MGDVFGTTNERRSAAETYSVATSSSHLRDEQDKTGAITAIGAAGMNPHQTGIMLLRLRAEWDGTAKPRQPSIHAIKSFADSLPKEVSGPHAGKVKELVNGEPYYRLPMEVAELQMMRWHIHELGMVMQRLKTLPEVRSELIRWFGGPHAPRIVASTLAWWLHDRCFKCGGCGLRVVKNTGGRTLGRPCMACQGTGKCPLAHGGLGRKLLAHITSCVGVASAEQESQKREKRSPLREGEWHAAKAQSKITTLRKADAEAEEDSLQDKATIAQAFARSMGAGIP